MDLWSRIQAKRVAAERARRIARALLNEQDQARVVRFAAEIDAEADALERGLDRPQTVVPHKQQKIRQ